MVYLKVVNENDSTVNIKTIVVEEKNGFCDNCNNVYVSENPSGVYRGFRITQDDLRKLYEEKKAKADKEYHQRLTEEEEKHNKELEEIKQWKAQMELRNNKWYKKIFKFIK